MNFTSSRYHLSFLPKYKLLIKTDYEQEHLLVLDEGNEVMRYIQYQKQSPEEDAMKLLSLPFEHVKLLLPTQSSILTPIELYQGTHKEYYQKFLAKDSVDTQFTYQSNDYGVVFSYELDEWLLNSWDKIYSYIEIIPEFQIVLALIQEQLSEGLILNIHEFDTKLDFYLFKNRQMLLFNSFEVRDESDLHFYLLHLLQLSDSNKFDKIMISQEKGELPITKVSLSFCNELLKFDEYIQISDSSNEAIDLKKKLNKMNFRVKKESFVCAL